MVCELSDRTKAIPLFSEWEDLDAGVAAKLILSCLDEGLYPAWDAANMASVHLAEKLGYEFSREYCCFGIE